MQCKVSEWSVRGVQTYKSCRISVSVTFGGIAAGLVGVAAQGRQRWDASNESLAIIIHLVGLIILATAIALSVAACFNFYTRGERLRSIPPPFVHQDEPGRRILGDYQAFPLIMISSVKRQTSSAFNCN